MVRHRCDSDGTDNAARRLAMRRQGLLDGPLPRAERASRRASADAEETWLRAETAAAIQRHLEFGLGSIHAAERQWSLALELSPWVEVRHALLAGDADAPLPDEA